MAERGPGTKRRKKPLKKVHGANQAGDKNKENAADAENAGNEIEEMRREFDDKQTLLKILQQCKEKRSESKKENRVKEGYVIDLLLKIAKSIFEMMNHITYQP